MRKRFSSMLVALTMLITSLVPTITANAAFSDVDSTHPQKEAITTLSTLKVINGYDDGTFAPDKEITRAEFTKMIVYMLNLGSLSEPITTFSDVPVTHWANANIKTAYDLGIVNGFEDVTFRPDDPVTYEQALKMVVCTLGYQPYAEQQGGYPEGYRNQASLLKLTDNISNLAFNANASRAVIAQIMFNALEVNKHEDVSGVWKDSEKTLLNDYLNVVSLEGVLVGVEQSTTTDCPPLSTGKMAVKDSSSGALYVIDFSEHSVTAADLMKSLGSTIQVYYRKDGLSDDKYLVEFSSEIHSNSELSLSSSEITKYNSGTVTYRKNGETKEQTARIDMSDISIRYNGRAVERDGDSANAFLDKYLNPSSNDFIYGTVRLVSNKKSSNYTMIDIYDYDVIVAQRAVQSSDYKLSDKLDTSSYSLDSSVDLALTRNDKEAEPTQIAANDVVLYAESLDGSFITVKATSTKVSGKIDSYNTTKKTVTISGNTYNYSEYFERYLREKEYKSLQSGVQIQAYTDALGTIQWGTVTSGDTYYPYAYVINVSDEAGEYYLRMFAPSSTSTKSFSSSTAYIVKTYKIAENVKLNGSKSSPSEIESELSGAIVPDSDAQNTSGYNQFIRVGFDSSGEVNNVITVSGEVGNTNLDPTKLVKAVNADTYKVTSTSLKDGSTTLCSVKSSTPLFVIPSDRTDTDGYALKNTISSSSMTSGEEYFVEAFDLNASKYPAFMAVYGADVQSGTPISIDTKFSMLVNGVEEGYDEDTYEFITSFKQSTSTTMDRLSSSPVAGCDFSLLGKGDIALFGYDSAGYVNDFDLAIDYSDVEETLAGDVYNWAAAGKQFGTSVESGSRSIYASMFNVLRALPEDNEIYVTKSGFDGATLPDDSYEVLNISQAKIMRYDPDADDTFSPYVIDTTTPLSIEDIRDAENNGTDCSKIAVISYISGSNVETVNFIVIYE